MGILAKIAFWQIKINYQEGQVMRKLSTICENSVKLFVFDRSLLGSKGIRQSIEKPFTESTLFSANEAVVDECRTIEGNLVYQTKNKKFPRVGFENGFFFK